jgi:hypothetical protein
MSNDFNLVISLIGLHLTYSIIVTEWWLLLVPGSGVLVGALRIAGGGGDKTCDGGRGCG